MPVRTLFLALTAGCAARHLPCADPPPDGGAGEAFRTEAADRTCLQGYRWAPAGETRGAVVVVHGLRDHALRYDGLAQDLAGAGFLVVAQDHRGHGRSGGRRQSFASVDVLVDDVALAVDRARAGAPGRPVFLFGHSLGGLVATTYALQHPDALAGLVLTGPALMLPPDVARIEVGAAKLLSRLTPGLRVQRLDDTAFVRDPAEKAALAADPWIDHRNLPARSAGAIVRGIDRVQPRFGELAVPLLVLHGTDDPATNPAGSRALVAAVPPGADAALRELQGAAHDLLHEPERDQVRAEIVGWIAARTPPAPTPTAGP